MPLDLIGKFLSSKSHYSTSNCSKACRDRGRWKSRCRGCAEIALCRDTLFLWQGKTIMGYRSCGTRPNQMSSQEKTRTSVLWKWTEAVMHLRLRIFLYQKHALLFWTLRGFVSVMTFYSATRLPFPISNSGQTYWSICMGAGWETCKYA